MCLSTLATATPAEVAAAAPDAPRWFQLYVFRDRGVTRSFVEQAVEYGYGAIVLTVDAPWLGRRERDLRTGFRVPEEIVVPSMAARRRLGRRDAARAARRDRSLAHLGGPRRAARAGAAAARPQGDPDRGGRAARGRARRRRDRRLEPRRPPARRGRADGGAAAGDRRGGRRPDRGLRRRRHPPRLRRRQGARARRPRRPRRPRAAVGACVRGGVRRATRARAAPGGDRAGARPLRLRLAGRRHREPPH